MEMVFQASNSLRLGGPRGKLERSAPQQIAVDQASIAGRVALPPPPRLRRDRPARPGPRPPLLLSLHFFPKLVHLLQCELAQVEFSLLRKAFHRLEPLGKLCGCAG